MSSRRGEEHLESKVIIRNYPADTTERDLRIMFEKYGKIEDCELTSTTHHPSPPCVSPIPILSFCPALCILVFSPKDKETRKPRGFTFCQYRRKEDAEDAVKGMDKRVGSLDCMHVAVWACCGPTSAVFMCGCICTVYSDCVFVGAVLYVVSCDVHVIVLILLLAQSLYQQSHVVCRWNVNYIAMYLSIPRPQRFLESFNSDHSWF